MSWSPSFTVWIQLVFFKIVLRRAVSQTVSPCGVVFQTATYVGTLPFIGFYLVKILSFFLAILDRIHAFPTVCVCYRSCKGGLATQSCTSPLLRPQNYFTTQATWTETSPENMDACFFIYFFALQTTSPWKANIKSLNSSGWPRHIP